MSLLQKIMFSFIFVMLFYILFRLVKKRTDILQAINENHIIKEALSTMSNISNKSVKKIMASNYVEELTDNLSAKKYYKDNSPLNMFHVKSSYHSAYNGKDISTDMVLYVLHRGYRFLDFEIYHDYVSGVNPNTNAVIMSNPNKKAVVSFTDGSTTSKNNLELKDILEIIHLNAFSNVPNNNDPLFIQIRPMYNMPVAKDTSDEKNKKIGENTQLNTQIEQALGIFSSYKYDDKVDGLTPIKNVLKKIIIIMDNVSNPYTNLKTGNLISLINMNPEDMILCNAAVALDQCNKDTNNDKLVQVKPNDSNNKILTQNPHSLHAISVTSCHFCPMMAWFSSYIGGYSSAGLSQLGDYETLFLNSGGSAFILLSEAKTYSTHNDSTVINDNKLKFS